MRTIHCATLLALIVVAPSSVQADLTLTTDITRSSDTFVLFPIGTLTVSDSVNNPLLTLTEGAQTYGIKSLVIGSGSGEQGRLLVEQGSTLSSTADGWMGPDPSYVGKNGSTGTAIVKGVGSQWQNSSDLHIGYSGSGTLTIENGGGVTNRDAYLGYGTDSSGKATVTGNGSQWKNSGYITIGFAGSGTLNVENGGLVTSDVGYVGGDARIWRETSAGAATVTGTGSQWQNSAELYVGLHSTGTLTVTDGGKVSTGTLYASLGDLHGDGIIYANGSVIDTDLIFNGKTNHQLHQSVTYGSGGTLVLDLRSGTGDLGVGYKGNGTLTISDGVKVHSSKGYVGDLPGSIGTASITGNGSEWRNSEALYVGLDGTGEMTIADGGLVTSNNAFLGYHYNSTAKVIVTGVGSHWHNSGQVYLNYGGGNSTLSIENGGSVTSDYSIVGSRDNYSGLVIVSGPGSVWQNTENLDIGNGSTVIVKDGGIVISDSGFIGDSYFGNDAATISITGKGSKWQNGSQLFVGTYGTGTLVIQDGGVVQTKLLTLQARGTISGNGGTIIGDVVSSGMISPGSSPGVLTIDGDLTSTGMVKFELAGTGSGLFDQLFVSGNLKLGGVVEIDLLDGFDPAAGNSFNLLDFGSFNNLGYRFDFSHAALKNGLSWDTSTFAVDGTIRVVPEASSLVLAGVGALAGFIGWRTKNRAA